MGEAIGPMLASAVAVALSPLPLIAVLLILAAPRGRTNGLAFTAGWVLGLGVVATVVVVAGNALDPDDGRPTWSYWLKLGLGTLLLLLAVRQWRDRPRPGHITAPPTWLLGVDRLTAARAAGLAVTQVVGHPRTLLPAVGGAASIAAAPTGAGAKAVAAALLVLIGSLGAIVPLTVHRRGTERSIRALGEWRAWAATHSAAITTTVPAVLGAAYLGDALAGLT
ncbi:GAP family protein [Kitasatospora sp. NPDC048194]|uniref:GAP family protein n=1 Tax=Kitasatospora sp. NPDC048194 TaxID=3364045 RepID=UPI003719E549